METRDKKSLAKHARWVLAASLVLAAPVVLVIGWLIWANRETMKPIDWIFIAVIPVTLAVAFAVQKLASLDYWDRFKTGFIADIRNRRLIGEVSVFCVLLSLVAFSETETLADGWPDFLRILGFNMLGAICVISLFAFGEAWWKGRRKRDD